MIEIICVNDDIYIETREDLEEFSDLLKNEAYDAESELIAQCFVDYFHEIWGKSQSLELEVKKRIDESLFIIIYLNFSITDNFSEIRVELASLEEVHLKKKEEVIFENLFKRFFETTKPLKKRLVDL